MDSSMVQACGAAKKETHTKGNGNSVSLKATACILGSTATPTKGNLKNA